MGEVDPVDPVVPVDPAGLARSRQNTCWCCCKPSDSPRIIVFRWARRARCVKMCKECHDHSRQVLVKRLRQDAVEWSQATDVVE